MRQSIFQDSFLLAGIMCHTGCGAHIQQMLNKIMAHKTEHHLPQDAELIIDSEPNTLGIHQLFVTIISDEHDTPFVKNHSEALSSEIRQLLESAGFEIIHNDTKPLTNRSSRRNWINILVNISSIIAITILSIVFPPSLFLTIGFTALSFLSTAFTARHYFFRFYQTIRAKQLADMATPITIGWILSLMHTLYHAISMPFAIGFSMIFMSFIMPVLLIAIVNVMDLLQAMILYQTKKMHVRGMNALFPTMSKDYACYALDQDNLTRLEQLIASSRDNEVSLSDAIEGILSAETIIQCNKKSLQKGMVIRVKRGECFPVDGIILHGNTRVDASIVTGEPQQSKQLRSPVHAGSINLGQEVVLYATENSYNSTVNQLLFRANRAPKTRETSNPNRQFLYAYTALIVVGLIASLAIPFGLGLFTIPLLLQNLTGILFAICPCTFAIADQLPNLLSMYQRHQQGIFLRKQALMGSNEDMDTIIFDKTGTLTTGESQVESSQGITSALWQRICLLEKRYGAEHPIAKAIQRYGETECIPQSLFQDISDVSIDHAHRGLSAKVQGKQLHIGNSTYLQEAGIALPSEIASSIQKKIEKGYTAVYVSENFVYQGIIFIQHEARKNIQETLARLKNAGKRLIMLTGDTLASANGFNQQNGCFFDPEAIHANKNPHEKELFLATLMSAAGTKQKKIWFIGDGLNDAPCARLVTEKGGISAAITSHDKAAFFTDLSLNGSLDYLFVHLRLNQFLKKNLRENQALLVFGALAFLIFTIGFSIMGITLSPLIPVMLMVSTTLLILFNSYRVTLSVNNAFDKQPSFVTQWLASKASIGGLVLACILIMAGLFISAIATGGLLPTILFTAGTAITISSFCILTSKAFFGQFTVKKGADVTDHRGSVMTSCAVGLALTQPIQGSASREGSILDSAVRTHGIAGIIESEPLRADSQIEPITYSSAM